MDRPVAFARIVIFFSACLLLCACKPEVRATALHIGDSLMQQSSDMIEFQEIAQNQAVLPLFNSMSLSALRDVDYWVARIGHIQEKLPVDVVFISLGSNDIHFSAADFPGETKIASAVEALLASFAPETKVYWILPHSNVEKLWSIDSHYTVVTQAILNARDSGNWPNLKTLDFDAWVASQQKSMSSMLQSDGIHLTEQGEGAWAVMIQNAIDTEFPIE